MVASEIRELASLKLTVDGRGMVWLLSGGRMPCSSGQDALSFVQGELYRGYDCVRVPGTQLNAELIKELYHVKLQEKFPRLEVCGPLAYEDVDDREDPELLLHHLRRVQLPPSLGGWHEFSIKDYPSYSLAAHLQGGLETGDYTDRLLQAHPVWPYLTFIEGIDWPSCSRLLAAILDPRWHMDPCSGTDSQLDHFLGLAHHQAGDDSARGQRYRVVMDCWKRSADTVTLDGPGNFLWRIWVAQGGGAFGDLAVCREFVDYLKMTWTMTLCTNHQACELFIPEFFFEREDEVLAYRAHLRRYF